MKKIIYDLGASTGENIPYYLLKSDLVIAIEANKSCCDLIIKKFKNEITNKRLIVENCIVSNCNLPIDEFYIHKKNYLLGQYPKPNEKIFNNFFKVQVVKKDVLEIINNYGKPHYIKIDLEEYDHVVLKRILDSDIKSNYISAEAINKDVINLFTSNLNYISFKLHEGKLIDILYKYTKLNINNKKIKFSFPSNSAGPYGNDIMKDWMDKENFIKFAKLKEPGWWDIHASLIDKPQKIYNFDYYYNLEKKLENKAKLIKRFRRLKSKLNFFTNE